MPTEHNYPGSPAHQALLSAIVAYYENDPRILVVALFGSLSRGNWDEHSDLDLDIVTADGAQVDVPLELQRLCAAVAPPNQPEALIVADGPEAGDVVFADLHQISIRYHPLATTKAAIVDSLRVLSASIDPALIRAAGRSNPAAPPTPAEQLVKQCVRYVVGADVSLRRAQVWAAVEHLHRIRGLMMELFAQTHGGGRALPVFQAQAPAHLQARLSATLPPANIDGLRVALGRCVDLLEHDLSALTAEQQQLSATQRHILAQVRARLVTRGDQA